MLALITSSRHRRVGAATQLVIDMTTAEGQHTGLRLNSAMRPGTFVTMSGQAGHRDPWAHSSRAP
jgi:hypothetical protein